MPDRTGTRPVPVEADVATIVAIVDPVARNRAITKCYHELAAAYATRAGGANWCTFATWASRQAGDTIRGEDLRRAADRLFARSPQVARGVEAVAFAVRALGADADLARLRTDLREITSIDAAFARSSAAVARGNTKVFEEIGREFARFQHSCGTDELFDASAVANFMAGLRDGDPPHGQRYLRIAFDEYYRALFEADPKRRAERMFHANLCVGFHEQTRLQPEIREALDAAVPPAKDVTPALLSRLFPHGGWLPRASRFLRRLAGGTTPLDQAVETLLAAVRAELRRTITEHLMTLAFPRGVVLRLGADLNATFPASLATIDHAPLRALLDRIDPTRNSVRASGALDWGDLDERMHFITDLFRCYHEATELYDAPFA